MFTNSRRSVQVAPRRSMSGKPVVIKQDVHSLWCFFIDVNIEHEFQTYYRRDRQAHLPYYMIATIVLSVLVMVGAAMHTLISTSAAFVTAIQTSTPPVSVTDRLRWISRADGIVLCVVFYVTAILCIIFLHRKKTATLFFADPRFDPVQLILFGFYQLVFIPVVLGLAACVDVELSHALDFSRDTTGKQRMLAFLGVSFVDLLYFYLLLLTSLASCLLRLQFTYFATIVLEFLAVVTAVSTAYYGGDSDRRIPERWSLYVVFVVSLLLTARGVWESELSSRREFLSHSNLLNENRRLSHQNIEMKEELTGKLNYQLHYEMGDILRILCQIKIKMSLAERRDIDKIITALVTNEDLFGVSLDPAMTEHEEEVQGWLHMMAFKEAPQAFARVDSLAKTGKVERKSSRRPATVMQAEVSRSTQSRKMSQNMPMGEPVKGMEQLVQLFAKRPLAEDRVELARWLVETLRDEVYIDMFYLDERCAAPMQAVFIACVELNDFAKRLSLDMVKVMAFAGAVENHYFKRNPYHNCLHAGAVIADLHFYMRRLKLNIDDVTFFVGLIAAAGHDISHPGVSNGFLIATRSKLAITYSDDSVLERMHIAELYRILSHEKFDIFAHMDAGGKSDIRKLLIQMTLATDLSRHFQHISKLKSRKFAVAQEAQGLEVTLIMETIMMLADLGHTVKPFEYHQLWANRIAEEFFRQGEAEERQNLPISPLCDRKQANLPRSQVAFLTLLATPLFETAGDAFAIEEYDKVMTNLKANVKKWQATIPRSESRNDTGSAVSTKTVQDKVMHREGSGQLGSTSTLVLPHSNGSEGRRREADK